jgi:flagellar biosynthetic protein FlhB
VAEDSDAEKTEPASSRRLEKAREEGDVPRSRELATVTMLLASGGGLWVMGEGLIQHLRHVLARALTFDRIQAFDSSELFRNASSGVVEVITAFAPLGVLLVLVAIAAPLFIGGWVFSTKAFMPNFAKLNPISGLVKMVSTNALVELLKALVKSVFVGFVAWIVISRKVEEFMRLGDSSVESSLSKLGSILWATYSAIVASLVVIAVVDVVYQIWHYADKMKMTRQEVKQEAKESDGNPETKAKIRQAQRAMSRRRMMSSIPTADVIVTNPTHFAVALRYSDSAGGAPRVVAKGADVLAAKIREIGRDNKIPLLEAPALARALHQNSEIGDEIPEALYSAVAEVLAYIYQLKAFTSSGGDMPTAPTHIEVPPELDPQNPAFNSEKISVRPNE